MSESLSSSKQPAIRKGICFVLSAPSGAGKSTIANALRASQSNLYPSVSVTTRPPRPGEVDGVHYHFISKEQFKEYSETGKLLEWATVFERGYGTPKDPVVEQLTQGKDMIFDIDWQGHRQIRQALPQDVVSIFILPPSLQELEKRLTNRASDHPEEIHKRMQAALDEISHWKEFDYVIINNKLDEAIAQAEAILTAERLKTNRQTFLHSFTNAFTL
ncbi:guanylate kinase [Commensalibacter oyaizuii]|uniref:Guanylate kinase n=1 Tax=Commensalibacter oyaizuii TaxID=3043873 RepID=A0ABT6Q241_9PROT|nr:guanylate kinase [Commensalibacter sp. TBRC 16381]MDI2091170.1 guanylate kinase [Commensalibacter sp. TBRC 16381]